MTSARITPGDLKELNAEELHSKLKVAATAQHCKGLESAAGGRASLRNPESKGLALWKYPTSKP